MRKLVFVTGAGRGIGQAIALHLAKEGYLVAGCARTKSQLEETQKLSNGHVHVSALDVTDYSAVANWMETTTKEQTSSSKGGPATPWGLVTAAGVYGAIGPFLENNWDEWVDGIEVNLYGTALCAKAFAKMMIARELSGRIAMLSGGGATQPQPNFSSYSASKAAVVRFGETIAHEFKPHNITVNAIAPGAVNTKFTEDALAAGADKIGHETYEKILKQKESGGTSPEKAAQLASYLMSDKAGDITGRLLSAVWDPWQILHEHHRALSQSDIYTLRRIVPDDRPKSGFKPGAKKR